MSKAKLCRELKNREIAGKDELWITSCELNITSCE